MADSTLGVLFLLPTFPGHGFTITGVQAQIRMGDDSCMKKWGSPSGLQTYDQAHSYREERSASSRLNSSSATILLPLEGNVRAYLRGYEPTTKRI